MPRWTDADDDWDDDPELDLEDDELDGSDDDEETTDACPYCRRDIYDDAVQCPYCGRYISREDTPWRKPWWLVLGVGACLYVVYRWIVPS
jgi:hypothetical protein